LKMTWRGIEGHELTSITAHNSTYMNETSDRDKSNIYQGSQERSNIDYLARNFTQELRLSSTDESSWEYTLGAFYSKMITRSTNTNDIAPSAVGLPLMYLYTAIEKESFGYFMNNRIDLSEDSELQIGLRYNRLRNDYVGTMELPAFNIVVDQNSERDYVDDSFTGGIKYVRHINDEIMAYTSLDVSHRPAGTTMNPRVVYHPEALRSSEEETLAFEAGFKSTLFNGRMQVNGAAYYQEMNEYQAFFKEINVQDSVGDSINPVNLLKNTDAISMGAELEATGLISENWRAGMLMSYNDFKFADGSEGYCNEGPALDAATNWVNSCDVSGSRIGNNPNWNVSISSDYLLPLDEVDLFLRGLYSFNGASFQPALPVEERKAGAHSLIDLFAGVRSKDSDWEVSLWAKNLLDKATETEKVAADENGYRDVTVTAPRTLGASLRYNFSL